MSNRARRYTCRCKRKRHQEIIYFLTVDECNEVTVIFSPEGTHLTVLIPLLDINPLEFGVCFVVVDYRPWALKSNSKRLSAGGVWNVLKRLTKHTERSVPQARERGSQLCNEGHKQANVIM